MKITSASTCHHRALLAAFLLLVAGSAYAQRRPNTTGLFLNVHLNATGIGYDEDALFELDFRDDTHSGGGAGVMIGYGFSPLLTLYLALNGSVIDSDDLRDEYTLAHVDAGVRFNLVSRSPLVPYLTAGLTFRQASFDLNPGEMDFNGGGVTVGGGLKYYLSPPVALDVGLVGTVGTFTEVDFGRAAFDIDDIGAASARLMIGLSVYPTRRR